MTNICQTCGMVCRTPTEYHPYAACLMFKACHDGDIVRANLEAVRSPAPGAPAGFKLVPIEPDGKMWSVGRAEFIRWAQNYEDARSAEKASVIGDIAGSDIYRAMVRAAPGAPGQEAAECAWKYDDDEYGTWSTSCGNLFSFTADGPEENDFKFCCYCGGKLAALPPSGEKTS